jgi:predicted transcriptional regulator
MADADDLVRLTAEIVSAHLSGNTVAVADVPALIASVHQAIAGLGKEVPGTEDSAPAKAEGAVSARKSLARPDKIISMIDGKPYSTLKRHITRHGFTPETYRQRFGLKPDYPMVAPAYSEVRKTMAKALAVGRKVVGVAAAGVAAVALAEALVPAADANVRPRPATRRAKPTATATAAEAPMALVETARATPPRRGARAAEVPPATEPGEAPAAPKRRGRPPKSNGDAAIAPAPAEAPAGKARRTPDDEFFDPAKG